MLKRSWFVWVVVVVLVGACKREDDQPLIAFDKAIGAVRGRVIAASTKPSVGNAQGELFDKVLAHPRVVAQIDAFTGPFLQDPKLEAAAMELAGKLATSPQLAAVMDELAKQHPKASEEQLDAFLDERFDQAFEGPAFETAWMAAFTSFIEKIGPRISFQRVEGAFERKLSAAMPDEAKLLRKWNKRLVELNGGKRPSPARAEQLYLEHAWADARIEALLVKLYSNATVVDATAEAFAKLLAMKSLASALHEDALALLSDANVQRQIITALCVAIEPRPDAEKLEHAFADLITSPRVLDRATTRLNAVLSDAAVARVADEWFERVSRDPKLRADIADFWNNW